jgi:hypothetical protein
MKHIALALALLATPAFADEGGKTDIRSGAPSAPAELDKRVSNLEAQVKGLQEQVQRADAIISALSRQRNEAFDRAVLLETRALAAEAAVRRPVNEPKK